MTAPKIFLLGNDAAALSMLHEHSRTEGYRTLRCRPHEVTDAHAIVKRAAALVILDLWTAGREYGWRFVLHLWADFETTRIPAIIATGETDTLPMDVDMLRKMHCQVLRKPLDAPELLSEIAAALGPSPASRARSAPPVAPSLLAQADHSLVAADGEAA